MNKTVGLARILKSALLCAAMSAFSCGNIFARDLQGVWSGAINLRGLEIRIVFDISKNDKGVFEGLYTSPEQGIRDMKIPSVNVYPDGKVSIFVADADAKFSGRFSSDSSISGDFSQSGTDFPAELKLQTSAPHIDSRICGIWRGKMLLGKKITDVVLDIRQVRGNYFADISVPENSPDAMPVFDVAVSGGKLTFTMPYMKASFAGTLSEDKKTLDGFMTQFGAKNRLRLNRRTK